MLAVLAEQTKNEKQAKTTSTTNKNVSLIDMCWNCVLNAIHHILCIATAVLYSHRLLYSIWFVESAPIYLNTPADRQIDRKTCEKWRYAHGIEALLKAARSIWTQLPCDQCVSVSALYTHRSHINLVFWGEYGYIVVIRSFIHFSMLLLQIIIFYRYGLCEMCLNPFS